MKTEIELNEATYIRNGIKVNYVLYDVNGDAVVTQTISTEKLLTHICDYSMNVVSCGWDRWDVDVIPADLYLEENLNEVVLAYLQSNCNLADKKIQEAE